MGNPTRQPGLPLGLGFLAGLGSALALYRQRITAGYRAHATAELILGVGAFLGVVLLVGCDAYDEAASSPPEPYAYQAVSPSEHWDLRYAWMNHYTAVDFIPDSPCAPAFTRAFLHGPEPGHRSVTLFLSRGPLGLWRVDRHSLDAAMTARDPEGQPRGGQCKDLSDGQETGEGEGASADAKPDAKPPANPQ